MLNIAKGQTLSGTGTVLDVFLTDPSLRDACLRDPSALSFAVLSVANGARTQVYPATPGERQAVDLVAHKLSTGHYYAAFTMPATAAAGPGEVCWYYTTAGVERESIAPIEILAASSITPPGYCLLSDVRAEGLALRSASDMRVIHAINVASRYIERVTERWFEPRYCEFELDGEGDSMLRIPAPIIAIESVALAANAQTYDPAAYRAYARHVTTGMVRPDDRSTPKLQMLGHAGGARWPRGRRNILVKGVFGYTDFDGSPTGKTPDLIRQACISLAMNYCDKMATRSGASGPIVREKTRDQEVQYSDAGLGGVWTGDSEVDMLLESFRRPPTFEVA